ncbi:hypothetical protein DEDE109153_01075 [Deinococcus deserti]|uniref:Uncharacterized protein n=1 Tax=Deinococcus deserti (strain DSM 17065 / CIP 109153 / LMG 22923 / VCD115) TaxID=546414 RepID=C1CVM5_DEIDV|nr:hypothetical protein [Deinococcus deserti]ACO46242.1 Hypothetical protein Deide_13080 [Deinococcus deserti VCD115]
MTGRKAQRLARLEAKRRAFEASHVRISDIPGFLLAVLQIVEEGGGPDTVGRVAGRLVSEKAQRVAALIGGTA